MKNNKKIFTNPEMEIIDFDGSQVILTSGFGRAWAGDNTEDWNLPLSN